MSINNFGIEIDFLPVGTASKSGDAIVLRTGTEDGFQIVVIDGGTMESGEAVVNTIRNLYGPQAFINHLVCTHPDGDHTSGLRTILRSIRVNQLWIHQPWLHAGEIIDGFEADWTVDRLTARLRRDFPIVAEICELAVAQGSSISEPFQGANIAGLTVMAPSRTNYRDLLLLMRQTPVAAEQEQASRGLVGTAIQNVGAYIRRKAEEWNIETLTTPAFLASGASNESSVVLFGSFMGKRILLTGDVGVMGLFDAYRYAQSLGWNFISPDLVQMPHHGARRNVSPDVLDAILGQRIDGGSVTQIRGEAIASAARGDEDHPRKVVLNAFKRRGYDCTSTEDGLKNYVTPPFVSRSGLNPITPFSFFPEVED